MKKKFKFKNILLILIGVYLCYIFINQQITIHRVKNEIVSSKIEYQKLKNETYKLQDEVKLSKTDKFFEKLARERLGFIKKGETPVISTTK